MENSLAVRSIDDLIDLESKDLRPILKSAAQALITIETKIAEINVKINNAVGKYGGSKGIDTPMGARIGVSLMCGLFAGLVITFALSELVLEKDFSMVVFLPSNLFVSALSYLHIGKLNRKGKEKINILYQQMGEETEKFMVELEEKNRPLLDAINTIPDKYRISLILNRFLEYLQDGEARSWAECIEKFKTDNFREEQAEQFSQIISNLEAIKANTRATAIFSGITAWNTW